VLIHFRASDIPSRCVLLPPLQVVATLANTSILAQVDAMMHATATPGSAQAPTTTPTGLRGYNLFSLDFVAQWPLSLVLSRSAIGKYQLLFRHLLFARYVERAVCQCWVAHQSCKELRVRDTLGLVSTARVCAPMRGHTTLHARKLALTVAASCCRCPSTCSRSRCASACCISSRTSHTT